jgi:short-subunit dehydrogenase
VPTALVTGASAGLGAEFARQLAARGFDLVLVARDADRLHELASRLSSVAVEVLPADLTSDGDCAKVAARLQDAAAPIDLLVNNAGVGTYASFGKASLEAEEQQLDLNVRAVLRLAHAAVGTMTSRRAGRILNVSSVAGFVPRGGNATYSASKAWVTMFSEGLSIQLAGSGVTVTAVHPGFTHTEFHERAKANMSNVPNRMWLEAPDVVREALDDTLAGKPISVPSRLYKTIVGAARTVPRPALRAIMARRGM